MSSFVADKIVMDGLTFDDVLLIPSFSEVLPRTVELKTKFSRNIDLNIPFVTAAMDTVTESAMAIAIAREGGIGVIHKNMSIEDQARQVAIVKRAENGMIYDPVTIRRGSTVQEALNMMSEYHIGGIPVVDDDNHLVGIVTNRDLRFERRLDRKVGDVMTSENLVTTHIQTDLTAAARILQENKIEKLPVVDADNKLVGIGITMPSMSRAAQKCHRGRLLPFGWWHILRAGKFHKSEGVDLLLLGILPEYRSKGANALLFADLIPRYIDYGFKWGESQVEMESNEGVQRQWGALNPVNHKRRRCYKKAIKL